MLKVDRNLNSFGASAVSFVCGICKSGRYPLSNSSLRAYLIDHDGFYAQQLMGMLPSFSEVETKPWRTVGPQLNGPKADASLEPASACGMHSVHPNIWCEHTSHETCELSLPDCLTAFLHLPESYIANRLCSVCRYPKSNTWQ